MRIEIVNRLIHKVMGRTRKRQASVEADLLLQQTDIRRLRGKVKWESDLNESRLNRARQTR